MPPVESPLRGRGFKIGGGVIPSASSIATAMDVAVGKRAAGSLARLRRITVARAGGMFGLIRPGGVGIALICCNMITDGLSPWNGRTPVHIS